MKLNWTRIGYAALFAWLAVVGLCASLARGEQLVTTDDAALRAELQRLQTQDDGFRAALDNLLLRVKALEDAPAPGPEDPTDPDPPPPDPPATGAVGMNLAEPNSYSTAWIYGDLLKQLTKYDAGNGRWVAFADAAKYGAKFPQSGYTAEGPWRVEPKSNFLWIWGPKDLSQGAVYFPGAVKGQLFHPLYLERLRPFSTLRFMDWGAINNAAAGEVVTWSDRTKRGHIPIEHWIELCNAGGHDAWFCMPDTAGEDYVRGFARLVRAKLRPGATVYVEWSNEVWNSKFSQSVRLRSPKTTGGKLQYATWAREAEADFAIWRDELEGSGLKLVCVLAGQAATLSHTRQTINTGLVTPDAIACAAYFGNGISIPDNADAAKILQLVRDDLEDEEDRWKEWGAYARQLGVPLLAYEGGQHLIASPTGKRPPFYNAYVAAIRSQGMAEIYRDALGRWARAGGGLFVAYNDVRRLDEYGGWGALEYQDQPLAEAHVYRALRDYSTEAARN